MDPVVIDREHWESVSCLDIAVDSSTVYTLSAATLTTFGLSGNKYSSHWLLGLARFVASSCVVLEPSSQASGAVCHAKLARADPLCEMRKLVN